MGYSMKVISIDKKKICKIVYKSQICMNKKTTNIEINNMRIARDMLKNEKFTFLNITFSFYVPAEILWDDNSKNLVMEYCDGYNVELCLRRRKTHSYFAKLLDEIYKHFITIKFYWLDFAPRNIIIDFSKRQIAIIDFEKGFLDKKSLKRYICLTYEEYSAFLFQSEKSIQLDDFFLYLFYDYNGTLASKRIDHLMQALNLPNILRLRKLILFEIVKIEMPCSIGFYPIVYLERILKLFGYKMYARILKSFLKRRIRYARQNFRI